MSEKVRLAHALVVHFLLVGWMVGTAAWLFQCEKAHLHVVLEVVLLQQLHALWVVPLREIPARGE